MDVCTDAMAELQYLLKGVKCIVIIIHLSLRSNGAEVIYLKGNSSMRLLYNFFL